MPEPKYQMQSNAPIRKVTASGLAGALSTILVWVLNTFVISGEQQITGEIAAAITSVVSFVVAYYVPPGHKDVVIQKPAQLPADA